MDSRLFVLRATLNKIEVHGQENLDMLLGCILTVESMINEPEKEEHNEQNPPA